METVLHTARVVVAEQPIRFVTTHKAAFDYLRTRDNLTGIQPFECLPDEPGLAMPSVCYTDGSPRHATYDPWTRRLNVVFPWEPEAPDLFVPGKPYRNLLLYPLRMALECVRQAESQYTVHASAVTRDGAAIVFAGDAEAGKTTTAMHLCHTAGFAMYANDQTVLSTRGGQPWVVRGDRMVSLRLSSIARYAPAIASRTFPDGEQSEAWNVKRDVALDQLGVEMSDEPTPLKLFVNIHLDDSLDDCVVNDLTDRTIREGTLHQRRNGFHAKVALYREITEPIRGAAFTPLRDVDLSLLDFYMPSLDEPEFVAYRSRFMNQLFGGEQTAVVSIRGPLDACTATALKLFEAQCARS